MPLYRWTFIFGRDRVECIDICISYHPAPARYMSVFKHTETRHLSCGIRMSTNAEPDVDSVDWSNGSVKEWSFHKTPLHLTKRTGLRNTFERNFRPCVPIWKIAKSKDTPQVNQSLPLKWWLGIHPAIGWNVCWYEPFGDHAPLKVASLMCNCLRLPLGYTKCGGVLKTH